jgi:hypothetical protein
MSLKFNVKGILLVLAIITMGGWSNSLGRMGMGNSRGMQKIRIVGPDSIGIHDSDTHEKFQIHWAHHDASFDLRNQVG